MARLIVTALFGIFILSSCAPRQEVSVTYQEPTPEGRAVEQAILWDGELDANMNSVGLKRLVADEQRFQRQGMSHLALKPIVVFGHRAAFVSYLGYGSLAGPNAVVKGTPKSVATYMTQNYGMKFRVKDGVYMCDYKPAVRILIQEDPDLIGATIVMGAYTGPR